MSYSRTIVVLHALVFGCDAMFVSLVNSLLFSWEIYLVSLESTDIICKWAAVTVLIEPELSVQQKRG